MADETTKSLRTSSFRVCQAAHLTIGGAAGRTSAAQHLNFRESVPVASLSSHSPANLGSSPIVRQNLIEQDVQADSEPLLSFPGTAYPSVKPVGGLICAWYDMVRLDRLHEELALGRTSVFPVFFEVCFASSPLSAPPSVARSSTLFL